MSDKNIQVDIKGAEELIKAFSESPAKFVSVFDAVIKKITLVIKGEARKLSPVDTGFMRGAGLQHTFESLTGIIEDTAPYFNFVHEGTKFMAARPFFDDAVKNMQGDVDKLVEEGLEKFNNSL